MRGWVEKIGSANQNSQANICQMTNLSVDATSDQTGYGLKNGKLVFIADVPKGLACECLCVRCGKRLIARKGNVRQHHFAHHELSDCRGASESVLHLLAKELISELTEFTIPPYEFKRERKTKCGEIVRYQSLIVKGGSFYINKVRVEERSNGFIPDLIIETGSKSLIVEVAVTHKVSQAKLRRIRQHNIPAIEVRLQASDALLSRDSIRKKLQLDTGSKIWLFHPKQRDAEQKFYIKLRARRALKRTFMNRKYSSISSVNPVSRDAQTSSQPSPSACDWVVEEFNRTHGRYPTMDECTRYWPHLWAARQDINQPPTPPENQTPTAADAESTAGTPRP